VATHAVHLGEQKATAKPSTSGPAAVTSAPAAPSSTSAATPAATTGPAVVDLAANPATCG
jgi:hypothetical protein